MTSIEKDTLFQAVQDSNLAHTVSAIDGDRPLIYVNQAFLDETGYALDEVIGKNCRFLQGEGTDPKAVQRIREALDAFEPIDIELLNYRKDGTPFMNRLKMSPVYDGDGKPVAFMGMQSNITSTIANMRVVQERYKLESLGKLSANISHEIKNAIQPVKLMIESLDDWENMSKEQVRKCIDIAKTNIDIAEHITHDVLRFSRRIETEKEWVDTDQLAEGTLRFIKNIAPNTITIEADISQAEGMNTKLHLNRNEFYQIITNIVGNAVDAMESKGTLQLVWQHITLDTVRAQTLSLSPGMYAHIAFTDSGPGIDEKVMGDMFQPFFSTKPPGEGTGLGLAITRKIMHDHGGRIIAANVPDGGAMISLYLPLKN